MARRIKITAPQPLEVSGWLDGKQSYLWFGVDGKYIGTLTGYRLYRLAKAIVKQWEAPCDK